MRLQSSFFSVYLRTFLSRLVLQEAVAVHLESSDISRRWLDARSLGTRVRDPVEAKQPASVGSLSTIWHKSTQCSTLRELRPPLSPYCLPTFYYLLTTPSTTFPLSFTTYQTCSMKDRYPNDQPIINSTRLHPTHPRHNHYHHPSVTLSSLRLCTH